MANAVTPTTTLSDLHDPPLDALFDSLPLCKLLRIDEVCSRWQELKPFALRRRRHLIIANDLNNLPALQPSPYAEHDLLKYVHGENETEADAYSKFVARIDSLDRHALFIGHGQSLQAAILDRLKELLPNLTVFQLVQKNGSPQELGMVAQLLDHYRHQLKEVAIVFWEKRGEPKPAEKQHSFQQLFTLLMDSLNRLTKLRNLKLIFCTAPGTQVVFDDNQLVQHSLPDLVGRLETFSFFTSLNLCRVYDTNNRLTRACLLKPILIGMRDGVEGGESADKLVASSSKQENLALYFPNTPLTLRTLISLGPGLVAAGLRSVNIDGVFSGDSKAEYKALARFACQSPHLQAITVGVKSLSIWRLVESLASLKELVTLEIRCGNVNPLLEAVNVCQLPVLPSVTSLVLNYAALNHRAYQQLHLETLFPNLQVVEWKHWGWGCTECGYEIPRDVLDNFEDRQLLQVDRTKFKATYGRQMNKCLRLARLSAFSRLPKFTHLLMKVIPNFVKLPFKDPMFTSLQSLGRRTEFVDIGKDPKQNIVLYR